MSITLRTTSLPSPPETMSTAPAQEEYLTAAAKAENVLPKCTALEMQAARILVAIGQPSTHKKRPSRGQSRVLWTPEAKQLLKEQYELIPKKPSGTMPKSGWQTISRVLEEALGVPRTPKACATEASLLGCNKRSSISEKTLLVAQLYERAQGRTLTGTLSTIDWKDITEATGLSIDACRKRLQTFHSVVQGQDL